MLRQASYGTIKIGTYQSLKRMVVDRPEGESPLYSPNPRTHFKLSPEGEV